MYKKHVIFSALLSLSGFVSAEPLSKSDLLKQHWANDDYQSYLTVASTLTQSQAKADGGKTDLRCGYIFVRLHQDLSSAKQAFQRTADFNGEHSKEGKAAVRWIELLENSHNANISDQSLDSEFKNFIRETQGGVEKQINAYDVGRRTYQYADLIVESDINSAKRLFACISVDPIYGIYSARAKMKLAELTGNGLQEARSALLEEEEVFTLQKELRQAGIDNDYSKAFSIIEQITTDYPDCNLTCETRLRKGYLKFRQGKPD